MSTQNPELDQTAQVDAPNVEQTAPETLQVSSSASAEIPPVDGALPPISNLQLNSIPTSHPLVPRAASTSAVPQSPTLSSSAPLAGINSARRPPGVSIPVRGAANNLPSDIQARLKAFHSGRRNAPPVSSRINSSTGDSASSGSLSQSPASPSPLSPPGGIPSGPYVGGVSNLRLPNAVPTLTSLHSAPAVPRAGGGPRQSLAAKRGMVLPGGLSGSSTPVASVPATGPPGRKRPGLTLSQMSGSSVDAPDETKPTGGTMMEKYSQYLDPKTGTLQFKGKATLSSQGVEFAEGVSFNISLDEVDTLDELGKGNYGTVYRVRHARPRVRRPGMGLAGNKASHIGKGGDHLTDDTGTESALRQSGTSGAVMAMKEIRLELDDAKFAAIIMELDVLHRCISKHIVDFYGAFFQEGAVYICMEFMDGGSIDKIYGDGIPEAVLRKIAYATTMGLKSLKEDHNIIHRDVKPTNILINTRGQIKICDFGVSGNLVASIAKTNIGCQSYMAPERISSGGMSMAGSAGGTYSVQSDIWSLGLTIIECALGSYPYPPETYNNIFSQLSAIVDGDPPDLPADGFSEAARNFVQGCLNKIPKLRPTYPMLLQHAWLAPLTKPDVITEEDEDEETPDTSTADTTPDSELDDDLKLPPDVVDREVAEWVLGALDRKRKNKMKISEKPALHAVALDAVTTPPAKTSSADMVTPKAETAPTLAS